MCLCRCSQQLLIFGAGFVSPGHGWRWCMLAAYDGVPSSALDRQSRGLLSRSLLHWGWPEPAAAGAGCCAMCWSVPALYIGLNCLIWDLRRDLCTTCKCMSSLNATSRSCRQCSLDWKQSCHYYWTAHVQLGALKFTSVEFKFQTQKKTKPSTCRVLKHWK